MITNEDKGKIKTAIQEGYIETLEGYINNGWDLNEDLTIRNKTILGQGINYLSHNLFGLNLDLAAVYEPYTMGYNALHWAVKENQFEVVKWLVSHDSNLNIENDIGNTPLHLAVFYDRYEIANYLIAAEADVNHGNHEPDLGVVRDQRGNAATPLHYAVAHALETEDVKYVELLLAHNADAELEDASGYTALSYAWEWQNLELIAPFVKMMRQERQRPSENNVLQQVVEEPKEHSFMGDINAAPLPPPLPNLEPPKDPLAALKKHKVENKIQSPKAHDKKTSGEDFMDQLQKAIISRHAAIEGVKTQDNHCDDEAWNDDVNNAEHSGFAP